MARSERWNLARLIHPSDSGSFFEKHFENEVLQVQRDDRGYYHSLLKMEAIDRVLTTLHLAHPKVHMANAAKELKVTDYTFESGLIDVARLYQEYADGGTIVLNNLEVSIPSLMDLCRSLEAEFSSRFQCNIYVTPGGAAQGLKTHYDTHDVFVLQIEGVKHWRIYNKHIERPFRGQEFRPGIEPGELTQEFDLHPGDMVYVPRGVMHDAVSGDGDSCHITLGILPTSWTDLLLEAVARVALEDSELRRTLPIGFARQDFDRGPAQKIFRDLLTRVMEKASFDPALDHFAADVVSTRHPLLYGQMQQVKRLPSLTVEDHATARPNLLYHLTKDEEHVTVAAYGSRVTLPVHAAEALEFALTHENYRIADMPGDLDDPGKLVLVRRLVREGLVEIL
jgi:ribosomal protein L16 Arg81 hydroxylase